MNDYKEEYITIRYKLMGQLQTMLEVYLTGTWDPLIKHCIIKELQQLIVKYLSHEFPDFPIPYLPHIKISFDDDIQFVGASVQEYLNTDSHLIFLGTTNYNECIYDLYCRESWDVRFTYVFYARYGHDESSFEKGSKKPAAEYMMGISTPLSIAYERAINEGYIA